MANFSTTIRLPWPHSPCWYWSKDKSVLADYWCSYINGGFISSVAGQDFVPRAVALGTFVTVFFFRARKRLHCEGNNAWNNLWLDIGFNARSYIRSRWRIMVGGDGCSSWNFKFVCAGNPINCPCFAGCNGLWNHYFYWRSVWGACNKFSTWLMV